MYTTLIRTADLAERLDAPGIVLSTFGHELSQPDWGEAQYRAGHLPGAISFTSTAICPRRRPAPTAAIRCSRPRRTPRCSVAPASTTPPK
jgi:3-mercaptopyruvate sulfurtransferase SseA